MRISFDPAKRAKTLVERGLDFARADEVFRGRTYDRIDDRIDYGEERVITAGHLDGRMVVLVWTARGDARHVISMRKANEREQARFAAWLD
nr:BrnT family toxin [Mesorhizobium sp.]